MLCEKCRGVVPDKKELWRTATLVGNWFIGFDDDGLPEVAGRISSGLGAGRYMLTYSFIRDGAKAEPTLSKDQIAYMRWTLYDNQSLWRDAFTKASK